LALVDLIGCPLDTRSAAIATEFMSAPGGQAA
jgi:hypothetical protein